MRDEVPRTRPPLQELFVHVLFLAFEQDCMKTHCNSFLVEACSGEDESCYAVVILNSHIDADMLFP